MDNYNKIIECENDREKEKTDIEDEILEDTTSMEEKLEAIKESDEELTLGSMDRF